MDDREVVKFLQENGGNCITAITAVAGLTLAALIAQLKRSPEQESTDYVSFEERKYPDFEALGNQFPFIRRNKTGQLLRYIGIRRQKGIIGYFKSFRFQYQFVIDPSTYGSNYEVLVTPDNTSSKFIKELTFEQMLAMRDSAGNAEYTPTDYTDPRPSYEEI